MPHVVNVKVAEIMSRPVITVKADTTIREAARLLVELGFSALPVTDAYEVLVGIVSEDDLVPAAAGSLKTVAEVMTRKVLTVSAASQVSRAARMMLDEGVKRVPVVQGRRVVGMLSRRDLAKVIARRDGMSTT